MTEYTKDGNMIIHGNSYYEKIKANKPKPISLSEEEAKNQKLLNDEIIKVTDKQIEFKKNIIKGRTQKGMKQKELALKCGVKEDIIRDIENGKLKPDNKLHQKLKNVLSI
tara:strand:- start:1141 stop:1470 length:330 start_codon:yes stop_codon:yes gene_type:complete